MEFFKNMAVIALLITVASAQAQQLKLNDPNGTNAVISSAKTYSRIIIGQDQPNNALEITTGGQANVDSLVDIGQQLGATNSSLVVGNGGLMVIGEVNTNNLPVSGIVVGDSAGTGDLKVGFDSNVETDHLVVGAGADETGRVAARNGGDIIVADTLVIGTTNNSGNALTIDDESSLTISETANLEINNATGATDDLNNLTIKSGGSLLVKGDVDASALSSSEGVIFESRATLGVGGTLTTKNNSINNGFYVLLDNALSTNHTAQWSADYMDIGTSTSDNSLIVRNGATARSTNDVSIGTDSTAQKNILRVEGSNSTFTAMDRVFVGINGNNNEFNVLDGGQADVSSALVIGASLSSGNDVLVSGTNSALTIGGNTYVGFSGGHNNLALEDGAIADFQTNVYVGGKSANNRLTLSDASATVAGEFIIGNGADASGTTGSVTQNAPPNTSGNMAMVGTNSTLNLNNGLIVGKEGSGSILNMYDGGIVDVSGDAVIGDAVGDNYIYLQRGSNTQFNVSGDLVVGKSEEGSNRFAIYGGTADIGGDLLLGATTNQHDIKNFIHLETTNTVLNVAGSLEIGASNSLNTLALVDGASASVGQLLVGAHNGTSNNTVSVSGDESLFTIAGLLQIGSTNSGGNSITLQNGGILDIEQGNISIGSTNDYLTVADGGILKTLGWDFDDSSNIVFESGSTLNLSGMLEGTNRVEGGLHYILNGAGASWNTGTNVLYVGMDTGNNSLAITNGAIVTATNNLSIGFASDNNTVSISGTGSTLDIGGDIYIGTDGENNSLIITNGASVMSATNLFIGMASSENTVFLSDTGSVLNVGSDLYIGTDDLNSSFNTLQLTNGAVVNVTGDAYLHRRALLKVDSKSSVNITGKYTQDEFSTLDIGVRSNQVSPNLVVGGAAEFGSRTDTEDNPIIRIFDEGVEESNSVTIVQAANVTIDGTDATGSKFESNIHSNVLLGFTIIVTNDVNYEYIILSDFKKQSIGDGGNLTGQLLDVSDEIESMASNGDSNAVNMVAEIRANFSTEAEIQKVYGDLYGEKSSSTPAHNVINLGVQNVAKQLSKRADNTRYRQGMASSQSNFEKPEGASGPHAPEQELQGWINGYGSKGSMSAKDGYDGYDANLNGFMVGLDASINENWLIGLAGGTSRGDIGKGDSSTDTKSIYGAGYASVGTKDWFADLGFIYGSHDINTTLGSAFDTTADYTAQTMGFFIGGGKEIATDYLIYTPQLSFLGNYYSQGNYEEESSSAVARKVYSFTSFQLQSSLGGSIGYYSSVGDVTFKPEVRAFWQHEWLSEEEKNQYRLLGGSGTRYDLFMQAPEKDILKLGIGSSAKIGEYLELRADLDTRLGSGYSDLTFLGSLRYQF